MRVSLAILVLAQHEDGGWGWTNGAKSDRYTTARHSLGSRPCARAGYPVSDDAFNKAIGYLRTETVAVGNADYQSKAVLLHALAVAGQGDFTVANLLHRERTSLSTTAIAYLALALVEMDRKEMAGDVLKLLAKKLPASCRRRSTPRERAVAGHCPGKRPREQPEARNFDGHGNLRRLGFGRRGGRAPGRDHQEPDRTAHETPHRSSLVAGDGDRARCTGAVRLVPAKSFRRRTLSTGRVGERKGRRSAGDRSRVAEPGDRTCRRGCF